MNKKLQLILLTLLLIQLTSCSKLIARVFFDVRDPKPESEKTIKKYALKSDLDNKVNFFYIDSNEVENINTGAFPKAYIFSKDKIAIEQLHCFASGKQDLVDFFNLKVKPKSMPDTILHYYTKEDYITFITPKFSDIQKTCYADKSTKVDTLEAEYYVVYFWCKMLGKTNKKNAGQMESYLKKHPEHNAKFIKINCDFQKRWGYTKKKLKSK